MQVYLEKRCNSENWLKDNFFYEIPDIKKHLSNFYKNIITTNAEFLDFLKKEGAKIYTEKDTKEKVELFYETCTEYFNTNSYVLGYEDNKVKMSYILD